MPLNPRILAAIRRRVGSRVPRAPRLLFPIALATEYENTLRKDADRFADHIIRDVMRLYTSGRGDARLDASEREIRARLRRGRAEAAEAAKQNRDTYEAQGRAIANNQKAQLEGQIRIVLGINMETVSRRVRGELDQHIINNVNLITRANEALLDQVEASIHDAFLNGRPSSTLEDVLIRRAGALGARTQLIARDQTNKFFGTVTRARHEDVGIAKYIWSTSLDERVRGNPGGKYPDARYSHWDREGKRYRYDQPPPDGHPGDPIQCRCTQTPDFEDLLR